MDDITTKHPQQPHDDRPVGDEPENPRVAYEHGDADVLTVSKYAIALAFGVLVAATAMWLLFRWFESRQTEEITQLPPSVIEARRTQLPPEPRLQATPKIDLKEFIAGEDAVLGSYKWNDSSHATARIPINEAIDIMAKRGMPSKPLQGGMGLDEEGYRLLPEKSSSGRTFEKIAQ